MSVVGTSQCNDLALVQVHLTGDEVVPYLEWRDASPEVGLPIYAAGYPLSDTEFTLTSGIVSKAQADGDMPWASIDYTIEMDANIQPGNSGGPVVDKDGRVVAVAYATAGYNTGTNQFFAIAAPLAESVVDELRGGDFESFGVWGSPFQGDDGSYLGLWVNAVEQGSTAWEAGVKPGDIIATLNNVAVGSDGTLAAYCDVIRTAGANPIAIRVVRSGTGEVLEGNLGSGIPLVVTGNGSTGGGDDPGGDGGDDPGVDPTTEPYSAYEWLLDETEHIAVRVPVEWTDRFIQLGDANGSGVEYPNLLASTNLENFFWTYEDPGVQILSLPFTTTLPSVGTNQSILASCDLDGVEPWEDGSYEGLVAVYSNCEGTTATAFEIAANPKSPDVFHTLYLAMVLVSERDVDAAQEVFDSFEITDP